MHHIEGHILTYKIQFKKIQFHFLFSLYLDVHYQKKRSEYKEQTNTNLPKKVNISKWKTTTMALTFTYVDQHVHIK